MSGHEPWSPASSRKIGNSYLYVNCPFGSTGNKMYLNECAGHRKLVCRLDLIHRLPFETDNLRAVFLKSTWRGKRYRKWQNYGSNKKMNGCKGLGKKEWWTSRALRICRGETICMILQWWEYVIVHLSKYGVCPTTRVDPDVHRALWGTMMCPHRFIVVTDVHSGGGDG